MAIYNIGSLIKRRRKQKGLTQDELALNVIDRASLSKIESGSITPSKKTIETLLQKLGYDPNNLIDFFLNDDESEVQKAIDKLDAVLFNETAHGNLDERVREAESLITLLEGNEKFMENKLNLQYVLLKKAIIAVFTKSTDAPLQMLMDAIKISIPKYSDKDIEDYHLSSQEARIINLTAKVYFDSGHKDDAINLLSGLKSNFDKHCIDKQAMGTLYPSVVYNLAAFLCKVGRFEECIKACDNAIEVCKQTEYYRTMPLIVGYKADCLRNLGAKEEHERLVKQVFYSSDMLGMFGQRELAREEAEKYGILQL